MPTIELTNRELEYLQDVIFANRVNGHSYFSMEYEKLKFKDSKDRKDLLLELESNVFNKITGCEMGGFKG